MLYKVTTFSPLGEPTTIEVNAKSMKAAAVREYCLVEDGKGKYRRYYLRKPVGNNVVIDKIWRDGKKMYLFTIDKQWQEVHPTDKYAKKQNEVEKKPTPKLKKKHFQVGDYPMIQPKKVDPNIVYAALPHAAKENKPFTTKVNPTLTYAEYVKKLEQQKATIAYLDETRDTRNSTRKRTLSESATGVTWRDLGIHGNTEKTSGEDNVNDTEGNTCSNGSTPSLSKSNPGTNWFRRNDDTLESG